MLGIPVTDGLVLALCPFTGSLRDFSDGGRHPTQAGAGLQWAARGGVDHLLARSTGRLVTPNDATLEAVTSSTFFLAGNLQNPAAAERLFNKEDAGGVQLGIYLDTAGGGRALFRDSGGLAVKNLTVRGLESLAFTHVNGQKPHLWKDAVDDGEMTSARTVSANDADVTLLARYDGTAPANYQAVKILLWYSRVLLTAEIAQLHTYSQSLITPRRQWPGSGLRYPGRGDPYTPITGDPMFLDNIQSARVSVANETSGQLSNTGMDIVTGTWRVSEDATGRYFDCVGAGQITRRLIGADGMTTRLFTGTVGASLTKTTTEIQINASGTDKIRAVQLEAA